MTSAFANASFYIALASPRVQKHAVPSEFAGTFTARVVTTKYLLTEVGNYLSHPAHRVSFSNWLRDCEPIARRQSSHRRAYFGIEAWNSTLAVPTSSGR